MDIVQNNTNKYVGHPYSRDEIYVGRVALGESP